MAVFRHASRGVTARNFWLWLWLKSSDSFNVRDDINVPRIKTVNCGQFQWPFRVVLSALFLPQTVCNLLGVVSFPERWEAMVE